MRSKLSPPNTNKETFFLQEERNRKAETAQEWPTECLCEPRDRPGELLEITTARGLESASCSQHVQRDKSYLLGAD